MLILVSTEESYCNHMFEKHQEVAQFLRQLNSIGKCIVTRLFLINYSGICLWYCFGLDC